MSIGKAKLTEKNITLAHGAGGEIMQRLIGDIIVKNISNNRAGSVGLLDLDDGATISIGDSEIVFTTDSYVIKPLFFPGGNIGKVAEVKEKVKLFDINIIQKDLGYPEVQADSLEEVADYGVDYIQKKFNEPFILEDAGLFIDVLDGFPGVYSKYVFYTIGLKGILKIMENETKRN